VCLKAIAKIQVTQALNQKLVNKSKNVQRKATRKHYGEARVLTVKEALKLREERQEKEDTELAAKA